MSSYLPYTRSRMRVQARAAYQYYHYSQVVSLAPVPQPASRVPSGIGQNKEQMNPAQSSRQHEVHSWYYCLRYGQEFKNYFCFSQRHRAADDGQLQKWWHLIKKISRYTLSIITSHILFGHGGSLSLVNYARWLAHDSWERGSQAKWRNYWKGVFYIFATK